MYLPEYIKNETNGILVPVANSAAISDAVVRLLRDRALGLKLAAEGKRFVKENFSLDLMAGKMNRLYREMISGKK